MSQIGVANVAGFDITYSSTSTFRLTRSARDIYNVYSVGSVDGGVSCLRARSVSRFAAKWRRGLTSGPTEENGSNVENTTNLHE